MTPAVSAGHGTPVAAEADLIRSLLFTPAHQPERTGNAKRVGADAVILDLEDGVPAAERVAARAACADALARAGAGVIRIVRINHPRTVDGQADLAVLATLGQQVDLVLVPKVEDPGEIDLVLQAWAGSAAAPPVACLVESALGLEAAARLATHPRVVALALGGLDLAADLGSEPTWEPLLFARSRIVQAAALAHIAAWDSPWVHLDDVNGLSEEATRTRRLGFTGKLTIHPRQVAPVNAAFAPTAEEVAQARRRLEAASGGGAVAVEGSMVDEPALRSARRVLRRASRSTEAAAVAGREAGAT